VVGAPDQVLQPAPDVAHLDDLLGGRLRPHARELLELDRIVEIEHQPAAKPQQVRHGEAESLRDERVGLPEDARQIARGAERLSGELLRSFRHQRDLVPGGEPARQLDGPDPGTGHARAHHVLAVVGDLHRTSHSRASM